MKYLLLLALIVCVSYGQPPMKISPSKALPQVTVEPELMVSRDDWDNKPLVPFTSVFIPFLQTDSTLTSQIPLLSYSKPIDVDFIANSYVYGLLHEKDELGPDVDYYSFTIHPDSNASVRSAPFFGYPLVPACQRADDLEFHTLLFGPESVPDQFIGNIQVPFSEIPLWVDVPEGKLLTSTKMDLSALSCDHFEPVQNATFCVPQGIVTGCAGGFPATTVMTSPPYSPYCNFNNALRANYNPANASGVYGAWPVGKYTVVTYEKNKKSTSYVLHLGYRGVFESIFPYVNPQTFEILIDNMPPRLAASYSVGTFWGDLVRYHSTVRFNKCKAM